MSEHLAIIVGVGPGLGAALVRRCAAEGMSVVAAGRSVEDRADLDFASGPGAERIHPRTVDATDPAGVDALFTAAAAAFGPPRLVVFNAGAYRPGRVAEIGPAAFEQCWRVGCFAGFLVGQAAARAMLQAGEGTILFTGATASLRGGAGFANLASPKFALRALAQSLARELGPQNIHVAHVIIDGGILLPGREERAGERGPDSMLDPDAIATAYWQLHTQHRSAWTQELDLRPWAERF